MDTAVRISPPDIAVVELQGSLDASALVHLEETLADLIESGAHHMVVNVANLDFIDGHGVGILLEALQRVQVHQGTLRIVAPNSDVERVLRLSGLHRLLDIYGSEQQAIEATPRAA